MGWERGQSHSKVAGGTLKRVLNQDGWRRGLKRHPRAKSRQKGSVEKCKIERKVSAVSGRRESLAPVGALSCLLGVAVTRRWGRGAWETGAEGRTGPALQQAALPRGQTLTSWSHMFIWRRKSKSHCTILLQQSRKYAYLISLLISSQSYLSIKSSPLNSVSLGNATVKGLLPNALLEMSVCSHRSTLHPLPLAWTLGGWWGTVSVGSLPSFCGGQGWPLRYHEKTGGVKGHGGRVLRDCPRLAAPLSWRLYSFLGLGLGKGSGWNKGSLLLSQIYFSTLPWWWL